VKKNQPTMASSRKRNSKKRSEPQATLSKTQIFLSVSVKLCRLVALSVKPRTQRFYTSHIPAGFLSGRYLSPLKVFPQAEKALLSKLY
jgi:hypothetical protein